MAFAVNAYSETPFSAEPSDIVIVPIGLSLSAQTGNFITQIIQKSYVIFNKCNTNISNQLLE